MHDVVALARELGFHRAAVVPVEPTRRHALYTSWLAAGMAGDMAYLATPAHVESRGDLRTLLGSARTLVVVALAYERTDPAPAAGDRSLAQLPSAPDARSHTPHTPAPGDRSRTPRTPRSLALAPGPRSALVGKIARYARGEDYHLVMRDRLVALAERIAAELGRPVATRPCVDSAPVLEREWAERGGIGFVAKNTMLIAPGLGSYVVLGELLLDVELAPTAPAELPKPRCGGCRACLDACPTGAFADAYVLDARRCISYLTIEHHGPIPRELRAAIGTWIFGCDVCQEVCPFNAGAGEPAEPLLRPRSEDHAVPDLARLAYAGTNQLRQFVKRTALRRVPREVLLRNVAVALGNTGAADAVAPLAHLLADASPLVRAHAAWALGRLGALAVLASHEDDDDASVRAEIELASRAI